MRSHWAARPFLGGIIFCLLSCVAQAAEPLRIGGSGSTTALVRLLVEAYAKEHPQDPITVTSVIGSRGALAALQDKKLGVALLNRPLGEKERVPGRTEVEFARSPLVIAVAVSNPLNHIRLSELARLHSDVNAVWPNGMPVRLVLRPVGDATHRQLIDMSPELAKAITAAHARPGAYVAATEEDALAVLRRVPGAIGPASLAHIIADKAPLKALALEGKTPSAQSIRDGSYPWYMRHHLVTQGAESPAAQRFVAFALSARAARILADHGCWVADFRSGKMP